MKLVLCRKKSRWQNEDEIRTQLRAATRRGLKQLWDVRVGGSWYDLNTFDSGVEGYALFIWEGTESELVMIKLADPENSILEVMDLPDDNARLQNLKTRNRKRVAYANWGRMKSEIDFSNAPPMIKKLHTHGIGVVF